ncbi:MAG: MFS transporter [Candidatus Moranbacteria bacterium]|nr:MFS transporter [Candidatus Moranbacteria bacterium]
MENRKIKRMYLLSFLFTFHIALSSYVNSTFLTGVISEKFVGVLYTLAALLTLAVFSKSVNILKYFGNRKLTMAFLALNMTALAGIISSTSQLLTSISFIIFAATNTLVLFCIDIFIEHWSDEGKTGKTRGLYLTIINIAWMLSPLISAYLITAQGGYKAIYGLAFIMVALMTFGLLFSTKTFKDKVYIKTPFIETFKYLLTNKHLMAIVGINFLLQFFYAWMVVYTPIYLYDHIGFTWDEIGIAFTVMLAPFVILGLPIGILVDKYHFKRRNILRVGFAIAIISTVSISFITSASVALWAVVLFMTRIGASMIETASEIYFFSQVSDEDANLLSIYRDMYPIAYIIAPTIATLVFFVIPFKYLFVILGLILSVGFYLIPKLKKINHEAISISSKN